MQYTEILEGSDAWFVARLVLPDQTNLSRAEATGGNYAVKIRVFDISSETTDPASTGGGLHYSVDVAESNTATYNATILLATSGAPLITDGYWNGTDDEGYNFRYRLQNSLALLEGGHRYKAEFHIPTDDFGTISWTAGVYVRSMLTV